MRASDRHRERQRQAGRGRDVNVSFGPILDQVRDFKVESIAESVYGILESLGYERVG
jgi:hypothetical protein